MKTKDIKRNQAFHKCVSVIRSCTDHLHLIGARNLTWNFRKLFQHDDDFQMLRSVLYEQEAKIIDSEK